MREETQSKLMSMQQETHKTPACRLLLGAFTYQVRSLCAALQACKSHSLAHVCVPLVLPTDSPTPYAAAIVSNQDNAS